MKLSKKLLKNFSVIAVVSILLTAVFSTAAFWFVFSDEQEAEVRQYTDKIISVYNSNSEIDLSKYYGIGDFRVTLIKSDGSVVSDSVDTMLILCRITATAPNLNRQSRTATVQATECRKL